MFFANKRVRPEGFTGYLLKIGDEDEIVKIKFSYGQGTHSYTEMENMFGATVSVSQTILTSVVDLPVCYGDKIELSDGRIMTARTPTYVYDDKRAAFGSKKPLYMTITLTGGANG